MYSVWNPVLSTFLAKSISPCENPLAFFTDIVVSPAVTEPVIVVALATHNCPPTAFTDSFSKVVVLNVPLILTFSNSAVPFPSDEIFHPFAKPSALIDEDEFVSVDAAPSIRAGVLMFSTVKSDRIVALAPIIKLPSPLFALGSKWNIEELISIFPSEPLIYCWFKLPIKNLSVLTSKIPPAAVENTRCLASLSPTNCIPTPCSWSSPITRLPEPL